MAPQAQAVSADWEIFLVTLDTNHEFHSLTAAHSSPAENHELQHSTINNNENKQI